MKKRIFSLLLAAAMMISLLPAAVFAEGESSIVEINGENAGEAFAAWTDGKTLRLTAGVELSLDKAIHVTGTRGIDLRGHQLKLKVTGNATAIVLDEGASLTVSSDDNSTGSIYFFNLQASGVTGFQLSSGASLAIRNCHAQMNVGGGTNYLIKGTNSGDSVSLASCSIDVDCTSIGFGVADAANLTASNATVKIDSGSEACAFRTGSGVSSLTGVSFTGRGSNAKSNAVTASAGTVTLSGCSFDFSQTGLANPVIVNTGAALTISSGSYKGRYPETAVLDASGGSSAITGGSFHGNLKQSGSAVITISAPDLSASPIFYPSSLEYFDTGWLASEFFLHGNPTDGCYLAGPGAELRRSGQRVQGYDTFQEAVDDAQDGDTVVLLENVETAAAMAEFSFKTLTFDLGGHSYIDTRGANSEDVVSTVVAGKEAHLTITNGTVGAVGNGCAVRLDHEYRPGSFTLAADAALSSDARALYQVGEGTTTIYGSLSSTGTASKTERCRCIETDSIGSTIYIEDGASVSAAAGIVVSSLIGEVFIRGGRILGQVAENISGTLSISGGVFSTEVTAYLKSGCVQVENTAAGTAADYPYRVQEESIASVGDSSYSSLAAAASVAHEGDVITVLADTYEGTDLVSARGAVIDLNGHTVEVKSAVLFGGYVRDSSEGRTGSLVLPGEGNYLAGGSGSDGSGSWLPVWKDGAYRFIRMDGINAEISRTVKLSQPRGEDGCYASRLEIRPNLTETEWGILAQNPAALKLFVNCGYTAGSNTAAPSRYAVPAAAFASYAGLMAEVGNKHITFTLKGRTLRAANFSVEIESAALPALTVSSDTVSDSRS